MKVSLAPDLQHSGIGDESADISFYSLEIHRIDLLVEQFPKFAFAKCFSCPVSAVAATY